MSKIKVTTYFLAPSQTSRMALAIGIAALPIIITALHIVYARESIASDTS